jgi:hypothetical protein
MKEIWEFLRELLDMRAFKRVLLLEEFVLKFFLYHLEEFPSLCLGWVSLFIEIYQDTQVFLLMLYDIILLINFYLWDLLFMIKYFKYFISCVSFTLVKKYIKVYLFFMLFILILLYFYVKIKKPTFPLKIGLCFPFNKARIHRH